MVKIRYKRGTASYLAQLNLVLKSGEPCLETDTGRVKYGDGTTPWNLLAYASGNSSLPGTNNSAIGPESFVGGGSDNVAGGDSSFIGAGSDNIAQAGSSAVAAGSFNEASGLNSVVLCGESNFSDGEGSASAGRHNSAMGHHSFAAGDSSIASADGQFTISSGFFLEHGDAQSSVYHMKGFTTDASSANLSPSIELQEGWVWHFDVKIVGYSPANGPMFFRYRGGVGRKSGESAAFVGLPTVESRPAGDANATVGLNGNSLVVTVSGAAAYWYATVLTTELSLSFSPLSSDMFVDIEANSSITSMDVSISGGDSSMHPSFDPAIYDYCIHAPYGMTADYTITINGSAQSGTIDVNKALHVRRGIKEYFIRVIPPDLNLPSIQYKGEDYVPGYYLVTGRDIGSSGYSIVFDENFTPVWYHYDPQYGWSSNAFNFGGKNHLALGRDPGNYPRYVFSLGMNSIVKSEYSMLNDTRYSSNPSYECHEAHRVKGPSSRVGNFISMAGQDCGAPIPDGGFYLQELTPDGQDIVWEFYSEDYFSGGEVSNDYYHPNAIDVNPITGQVLVNMRHTSCVMCIDPDISGGVGGNIIWILSGPTSLRGSMFSAKKSVPETLNTKWLDIVGEPNLDGFQYAGPSGNHDVRWCNTTDPSDPNYVAPIHGTNNLVIHLYDNQTYSGGNARGVVYEIDVAQGKAYFRAHAWDPGSSSCCGSYSLVRESNGTYSHLPSFVDHNPGIKEFNGGLDSQQNLSLVVDMPGVYRFYKVREDQLDIRYLRTTSGRSV